MEAALYEVIFDSDAQSEALDAAEYIAKNSPLAARNWYRGLEDAIKSLEMFPSRCGYAPQREFLGEELRHFIFKSHPIIFRVSEAERVVRIRLNGPM